MLKTTEIKQFIDEHMSSVKYQDSKKALHYYEGRHDIKDYKIYYYNSDGLLEEDTTRSNMTISHPFFTEQVDQCTQYMLSKKDRYALSDDQKLQAELDKYYDDDFKRELSDLLTYTKVEGDSYLYRYVDEDYQTRFKFADGLNVVEVPSKYASDKLDHVIYYYFYKKEKNRNIFKIEVWDSEQVYFYKMFDSTIMLDKEVEINPRPHVMYSENDKTYYDTFNDVPFLRLDNNRKRTSDLYVIKDLIDDYDLMACGLSNNLQDVAEGIYVVKGWQGDNLDELTRNIKTKKQVSVGEGGDLDIKTINIPYQARQVKLGLDEVNIYRFGMAFNTAQMGDGNVTNVVIRSRYALLDLKCNKFEHQLLKLMKKVNKIVIDEINTKNNTAYSYNDVWFDFEREIMTNALDNAQMEQIKAQTQQIEINTLMALASKIGDDLLIERVCEVLDLDYNDVKSKIAQNAPIDLEQASNDLMAQEVADEQVA